MNAHSNLKDFTMNRLVTLAKASIIIVSTVFRDFSTEKSAHGAQLEQGRGSPLLRRIRVQILETFA